MATNANAQRGLGAAVGCGERISEETVSRPSSESAPSPQEPPRCASCGQPGQPPAIAKQLQDIGVLLEEGRE
jgi:hypothetical protein